MRRYAAHRYAILFYTLLLTLAAAPLLAALRFSTDLLQVFLAFSLLAARSRWDCAPRPAPRSAPAWRVGPSR